jgi:hypothetical protein
MSDLVTNYNDLKEKTQIIEEKLGILEGRQVYEQMRQELRMKALNYFLKFYQFIS